jgi:hypothetical protein
VKLYNCDKKLFPNNQLQIEFWIDCGMKTLKESDNLKIHTK